MSKVHSHRGPAAPAPTAPAAATAPAKAPEAAPEEKKPADMMGAPLARRKLSITGRHAPVSINPAGVDPALAASARAAVRGAGSHRVGSTSMPSTPMLQAQAKPINTAAFTSVVRNQTSGPLTTASGPISKADWAAPETIVSRMTQNAAGAAGSVSSSSRCGPTNLLATALLQGGQRGAAALIEKTIASAGRRLEPSDLDELRRVGTAVRNGTATFEDLSSAQSLLYAADNTRAWLPDIVAEARKAVAQDGSLTGAELAQLTRLASKDPDLNKKELKQLEQLLSTALDRELSLESVELKGSDKKVHQIAVNLKDAFFPEDTGLDDREVATAAKRGGMPAKQVLVGDVGTMATKALDTLKPGQAAVLRVAATDVDTSPGHFVTVGKLPDGRPYLYNPDPAQGDATFITGAPGASQPADFTRELAKYDKRSVKEGAGLPPITIIGKETTARR